MAHNFYYNNFIDKEEKKLDNLRQSIDEKEKEMKTMFLEKNIINYNSMEIAKLKNIPLEVSGLNALAQFKIKLKNSNAYKTLITQEMLKNNILATDTFYVSIKHNKNVLEKYFENLEKVFDLIQKCEKIVWYFKNF